MNKTKLTKRKEQNQNRAYDEDIILLNFYTPSWIHALLTDDSCC